MSGGAAARMRLLKSITGASVLSTRDDTESLLLAEEAIARMDGFIASHVSVCLQRYSCCFVVKTQLLPALTKFCSCFTASSETMMSVACALHCDYPTPMQCLRQK